MRLREIRQHKGITLQTLAKKAGQMSYTFLSKVENGKADPSLSTLQRLAKALQVTMADLLEQPQTQRRRKGMTYKDIYKISKDKSITVSERQDKLEANFYTLICNVRDKPPTNKTQSDAYWYKAIEISREISRIRESR
jgi:transcriptional regulator with XRE-family HTH domain